VQVICIWSSWCHCHPITSCSSKIQNVFTFLVPAYPGCPGEKAVAWLIVVVIALVVFQIINFRESFLQCFDTWLGGRKGIRPVKNMGDGGDEH